MTLLYRPIVALTLLVISAQNCIGETQVVRDVEFAKPGGHSLKLDLYLPEDNSTPRPTVVFVHGGGWKNGSKKSAAKNASWLSEHGFIVVGISYRLTDVAGWPAQIDDCYTAIRWLREHSKKYNIDSENIGVFGTSAGAHLVALIGTRPYPGMETTSSRVKAVCDWFGPSDLLTMPPNNIGNGRTAEDVAKSNGALLLRATVREVPKLARDASGLHNVSPDDASFLIMHGSEDPGVPLEQSLRLHLALVAANVPSQLKIVKGAGHGGKLFQTEDSKQTVLRFFQRTLMPIWPQGTGPNANFSTPPSKVPTTWSVVRNEGLTWKKNLPETGQSTVTIWDQRIFFTTLEEVQQDSELGQDIVAWCCDAQTGKTIWKTEIPGQHPLRLSGCFSDSSAPSPVTDGKRVCFFNASGSIACFDFEGQLLWSKDSMAVGRSQPFLLDDSIVFTRQIYMPDDQGHFTHKNGDLPPKDWTNLQAIDFKTGNENWTSECGVNMGSVPLPLTLNDGRQVIVVGRGGGHAPPEKPEGISMISAVDGSTIWTLPLKGFMSTMTNNLYGNHVLVFHDHEHLWVNANSGEIERRVSFLNDVSVRRHRENRWSSEIETLPPAKKARAIIQQSNVLVGKYHYFRSYTEPYLGRVDVVSGKVEFLQLPVQLKRTPGSSNDQLLWDPSGMNPAIVESPKSRKTNRPKQLPINQWCFTPNDMKNSRGFEVMGDARSRGTGWGHHASQVPTAVGNRLFVPVMNGTVYVIASDSDTLNEKSIIAINDLGLVGKSFNRASLSFAGGRLYAHTISELICIGQK